MFVTQRVKACLFGLGLLTLISVGGYLENAKATGVRVRQWSVSWTETRFVKSTDKGITIKNCYGCSGTRIVHRYWVEEDIYKVTVNYLDDGESVQSIESEKFLRDNDHDFFLWYDHASGSDSQCGG